MKRRRGQALVEFALITPLMLLIIMGGVGVGLLILERIQLQHAVQQAAVAGAQQNGDCASAMGRLPQLLGRAPTSKSCNLNVSDRIVTVTATDTFRFQVPLVPLPRTIYVVGRATTIRGTQ